MRPKRANGKVTLREYISFLFESTHPVSGNLPEAAKFLKSKYQAELDSGKRDPRLRELAHNLSVHGMFNAGKHPRCSRECRAQGIRRTVEGDLR